jgi:hypothetical protein
MLCYDLLELNNSTGQIMEMVIRFIGIFNKYYLCHAASYQNAFSSSMNGFATRAEAEKFATDRGVTVVRHSTDQLQID